MRVLYISQLADPADPRRGAAMLEVERMPGILRGLGLDHVFHDATLSPPPSPEGFDAVIMGGSFGSANDTEPWRLALREWLLAYPDVPFFGICGGHQLLAKAHGAAIEACPASQIGVYPLELCGVPGFQGRVLQLHHERVAAAPPGATVWATDDMGIQALRFGPHRWTFQFHPEMDEELANEAASASGHDASAWQDLDRAVVSGRAVLDAWIAAVRGRNRSVDAVATGPQPG